MFASSACAANYTTPCAPCYLAAFTTLHTFPYELTTIKVEATPYVYPESNGSSSTSWKYVTLTETLPASHPASMAEPTGNADGITFSHPTDVTWTTRDLTLTYPTTYVEYHDFAGVGTNATTCAQTANISQFNLASATVEMSFVMALNVSATSNGAERPQSGPVTSMPQQILGYLDTIPAVTSQLGGHSAASCLFAYGLPHCDKPSTYTNGCSSYCGTGVPTSTVTYTTTSTSIRSASTQTLTTYSWNSPSYSYITHQATTLYSTRTSETALFNTKGNHTTVSCWTFCNGQSASTPAYETKPPTYPSPPSTYTLKTASVLTTINKDPIIATLPPGMGDESTTKPNRPSTPTIHKPESPVASPTVAPITPKPTVSKEPQAQTPNPHAPPPEATSTPADYLGSGVVITAGTQTLTASAVPSGMHIAGTTVSVGGDFTMSNGDTIHVDSDGVQMGPSTLRISSLKSNGIEEGMYTIAGQTLTPGGKITQGTATISMDASEKTLYVNDVPSPMISGIIDLDGTKYLPITTASTTKRPGFYVVDYETLSPGGVMTEGPTTVSLGEGGKTYYMNASPTVMAPGVINMDGTKYVARPTSGDPSSGFYVTKYRTLAPGEVMTQESTTVSMDQSGKNVYINGSPTALSPGVVDLSGTQYTVLASATTTGMGDYIMGGISPDGTSPSTETTQVSESRTDGVASETTHHNGVQHLRATLRCIAGAALVAVLAATL